jgi:two-component system response regulator PilR (NtrC family)
MSRILIVDDERGMREMLSILLEREGYDTVAAENGETALRAIQTDIFDLVITDLKMPRMDGMALLRAVKEHAPDSIVIIITAFGTAEGAEQARSLGAYDYIGKPFNNEEIKLVVRNALEKRKLRTENILLKREFGSRAGFENFIGRSGSMQRIFSVIRQVADTRSTVLITGESGTGKELVARAIHAQSSRNASPYVTVNCGAIPESLLESELFGHLKGSFTGAVANKQGLFEAADGGTIFLDEISATTPALQTKLLRVLQEREFKRIGGTKDIRVDVRVIAASNRNLAQEVARGAFREDLYYRLNVIPIHLPPLRERREDIPLLIDHFLRKSAAGGPPKRVASEAMAKFVAYHWPGNVRELENTIERLSVLVPGDAIGLEQVPDVISAGSPCPDLLRLDIPESGIDLECLLEKTEKDLLARALGRAGGNKTEAARLLGLSFRSFRHRLHKYGMS